MLKYEILSPALSQQMEEERRNGTFANVGFDTEM